MKLEHIHITVNAKISPNFKALPKDAAQRFVDRLMKTVNMKPLGPLNWSDAEDLDFPGQSYVQMITTSHTSLHLFTHTDGTNEIYFDLYSCKKFDAEKVVKLLDETFGLVEWHGILYNRANHDSPHVKIIGTAAKEMMVAKVRN
ncbi:S-adenosylmethionine decarboxylase [Candidatus Bilamarchaeum dharawalense]|uniref:S-adenosylmethionine decarboxylase n=1 Tax=Candidatus Bilamarchaeum dharawalense TaxID=2885759 RepID=A0A5E4LTM2_9ARCH|nr:S-adenosylmethionine decarboxylase [Candidatus Bilamarchaeum dharawalense]